MDTVSKVSMREQVYNIIKDRILSQQYDLGSPINITSLSKELSISNTPIREALTMLQAENLVTSTLNSKFHVVELTDELLGELNQACAVMLIGAYQYCRITNQIQPLLDMLQDAYETQRKALSSEGGNEYIRAAINFDRCFLAVLNNQRLLDEFDGLSNLLLLSVRYVYQKDPAEKEEKIEQHGKILDAVRADDPSQVQDLIRVHYCN